MTYFTQINRPTAPTRPTLPFINCINNLWHEFGSHPEDFYNPSTDKFEGAIVSSGWIINREDITHGEFADEDYEILFDITDSPNFTFYLPHTEQDNAVFEIDMEQDSFRRHMKIIGKVIH